MNGLVLKLNLSKILHSGVSCVVHRLGCNVFFSWCVIHCSCLVTQDLTI